MSSAIESCYSVSCAQSPGIGTSYQNMYDKKISEVDMRIVMQEGRANLSVMDWVMVLGVVVTMVGADGGLLYLELSLAGAIHNPVETNIDSL